MNFNDWKEVCNDRKEVKKQLKHRKKYESSFCSNITKLLRRLCSLIFDQYYCGFRSCFVGHRRPEKKPGGFKNMVSLSSLIAVVVRSFFGIFNFGWLKAKHLCFSSGFDDSFPKKIHLASEASKDFFCFFTSFPS